MKPCLNLIVSALLISFCLPYRASAQGDCPSTSRSAVEVEKCLNELRESHSSKHKREPVTFPIRFHGSTRESMSSPEVAIDWYSSDGRQLEISTPKVCGFAGCAAIGKDLMKIPVKRIVSYEIKVLGNSTNASEQIQTVAIAAFLLPVAAPLAAAINSKTLEVYQWSIVYVDDEGHDKVETFMTSSTVPVADRYYTFLPTLTGLTPGQRRQHSDLEPFYKSAADKLEKKVKEDESLLIIPDRKKPWCLRTQYDSFPLIAARYEANRQSLNAVRTKLGLALYPAVKIEVDSSRWQSYINLNPNLAVWAKKNPTAADRLKKC